MTDFSTVCLRFWRDSRDLRTSARSGVCWRNASHTFFFSASVRSASAFSINATNSSFASDCRRGLIGRLRGIQPKVTETVSAPMILVDAKFQCPCFLKHNWLFDLQQKLICFACLRKNRPPFGIPSGNVFTNESRLRVSRYRRFPTPRVFRSDPLQWY